MDDGRQFNLFALCVELFSEHAPSFPKSPDTSLNHSLQNTKNVEDEARRVSAIDAFLGRPRPRRPARRNCPRSPQSPSAVCSASPASETAVSEERFVSDRSASISRDSFPIAEASVSCGSSTTPSMIFPNHPVAPVPTPLSATLGVTRSAAASCCTRPHRT